MTTVAKTIRPGTRCDLAALEKVKDIAPPKGYRRALRVLVDGAHPLTVAEEEGLKGARGYCKVADSVGYVFWLTRNPDYVWRRKQRLANQQKKRALVLSYQHQPDD